MDPKEQQNLPDDARAPRYERHDLKPRWLVAFALGLLAFALVAHLLLTGVFHQLVSRGRAIDAPPSAISTPTTSPTTFPTLQPSQTDDVLSAQDLQARLAMEDNIFQQLGWQVNPASHRIRPPEALVNKVVEKLRDKPGGAR